MSKSQKSLCVSFSSTDVGLCMYYLLIVSNLNFLHISQWITLPSQSCLVLYSFCANLLHSLMWLMVSFLSPRSLHLRCCCILSILPLIWFFLMALFCAVISRFSVLLLLLLLLLFSSLEFFTSVLTDGFSREFEWQQVSSSLHDSSQDSGPPQQFCRLNSLYPSGNFQVLQAL